MVDKTTNPELYQLVLPINKRYIKPAPAGKHGSYIPHWVISQAIMLAVGHYDFEVLDILRGSVPEYTSGGDRPKTHAALPDAVVGVVCRLTVTVDGRSVAVDEVGSCDAYGSEWNDGERLKKATSDALKRCAMRLGVGLQMWCKTPAEYFLPRVMYERAGSPSSQQEPSLETDVVVAGEDDDG